MDLERFQAQRPHPWDAAHETHRGSTDSSLGTLEVPEVAEVVAVRIPLGPNPSPTLTP